MKQLVITKVVRVDALPGGQGASLQIETSAGVQELRFTYEDAERLVAAFESAQGKIQEARAAAGKPPLAEQPKVPASWETAVDPVNQVAVIRARFADQTTRETEIPRKEIAPIAEFLREALKRFEAGAEMRQ